MAPKPTTTSNWDPILLISQIVSIQTLHYLTLCLITPPLLAIFAEPTSLKFEGGATSVGMIMDWRHMAGRPSTPGQLTQWGAWSGGKKINFAGPRLSGITNGVDPMRSWVIAFCWIGACGVDIYYLYALVRRPRLILDFALTLIFDHLVLTTYYSAAIPTSLFFWLVMIVGAILTIVPAEQLCVKREMAEGLAVNAPAREEEEEALVEEMEMGNLRRD